MKKNGLPTGYPVLSVSMNRILFLTTFFLIIFSIQDSVFACTSFAVFSNHVFYGMNFDFADAAMKFLITTNGDMKTFHLAFERVFGDIGIFVKTAGMNTKGLFSSCQEQCPLEEISQEFADGNMYVFQLYEKIDCLSSVGQIEKITDKTKIINFPELNLHNLFADKNGNAIVTESGCYGNAVTRMDGRFMVMTNFANYLLDGKAYTDAEGKGAERYKICHEYLHDTLHNFTIENGFELLKKACNRDPEYPTGCSMVFDPQNNDVYIVLFRDYKRIFKLSIENSAVEIWRGHTDKHSQPVSIGDEGIMISDLIKHFL
ncbi:MAG: hypothetical protein GY795_10695 [Desulfobacterales bacterium]|nr:hypothetical protein [Desulfobacterales bacterium]